MTKEPRGKRNNDGNCVLSKVLLDGGADQPPLSKRENAHTTPSIVGQTSVSLFYLFIVCIVVYPNLIYWIEFNLFFLLQRKKLRFLKFGVGGDFRRVRDNISQDVVVVKKQKKKKKLRDLRFGNGGDFRRIRDNKVRYSTELFSGNKTNEKEQNPT